MSVDPTCPMVHFVFVPRDRLGSDTPSLPPYECQTGFLFVKFSFSAPEVLGCSPAILQLFQEPEFELLRCVPQRIVLSPSWASPLIRVDCQLKPPLLRAVYDSPPALPGSSPHTVQCWGVARPTAQRPRRFRSISRSASCASVVGPAGDPKPRYGV